MKISRLFAGAAMAVVTFAGVSAAQGDLADPKEILSRSREALKKAGIVSYDATVEATEWLKDRVAAAKGKAVVGPNAEHDVPRFYCDVEIKTPKTEEKPAQTLSYKAGCDGNVYFLIDASTKKAHTDIDPVVLGSNARDIQRVILPLFTDKEPFKAELEAETYELCAKTEVGGEPCYQVYAVLKNAPQKAIVWEISTKDLLPRRVTRWYANREASGPDGTTIMTLTNLTQNPKTDKDPFKLAVPEGYTKTDEFAP